MRLATCLVLLYATATHAQLCQPGVPASEGPGLSAEVPVLVLDPPELSDEAKRPLAQSNGHARWGIPLRTSLDPETHGLWEQAPDGALVWRIALFSPGARSLGVGFDRFDLPEGGRVFVYSPSMSQVLGAFTRESAFEGRLGVQPLRGDRAVVEYVGPLSADGDPGLSIESVVYDFTGVLDGGVHASSVPCYVDVNCPRGASHQDVKRSVAVGMYTLGPIAGHWACTGTLLNNTAEDGTPYYYTADHCIDLTDQLLLFGYERSRCGAGETETVAVTLFGGSLLARVKRFDGALFLLNDAPPPSAAPYFSGWSREPWPPGPCVSVSHPLGLPKKITFDQEDPRAPDGTEDWIFLPDPPGSAFEVEWEEGLLANHSSGSALFDRDEHVIGSLHNNHAINNPCLDPEATRESAFGRFGKFYAARDLGQWLDPLGLDPIAIDGFDPNAPIALVYNGSGTNPEVLSGSAPRRGRNWRARIATAGVDPTATATILIGHAAPASSAGPFAFGELLVDPLSPRYFVDLAPVTGNHSRHALRIPANPAFAGLSLFVQGFLLGTSTSATNGLRLILD